MGKTTDVTAKASSYLFGIDRGGTFTDIVAWTPDGGLQVKKILSSRIAHTEDSAVAGIREILGLGPDDLIDPAGVQAVCMGTTVGTNALLERNGSPTVLITTAGYKDSLKIGYQNRPRLFDLEIKLPSELYDEVVEVSERVDKDGNILRAPDEAEVKKALAAVFAKGFKSCAIAFMHAYRYPEHERIVARIAKEVGFTQVSLSHECSGMIKYVARAGTAVVDAYLTPVLRDYTRKLDSALGNVPLYFMQSNGGLVASSNFRGKDCILSGPAGGIVGAVANCAAVGIDKIIGFDMGGTSTDVWHYAGHFERTAESYIAGARVRSPTMMIHTVAAGGGSIISFDGGRFRVGPESAGANPGPASYGNGGPLTVTDCNVVLGRIPPQYLPSIFGPDGDRALDAAKPHALFDNLVKEINFATGGDRTKFDCAEGFLDIAIENMANAIKKISTEKGYDLSKYTLACFGGAGGQHVCKVAEKLSMKSIFVHPLAGVMSAYGMGIADFRVLKSATLETALVDHAQEKVSELIDTLATQAASELSAQGVQPENIRITRRAVVRYRGASSGIEVVFDELDGLHDVFEAAQQKQFGFVLKDADTILESVTIEAAGSQAQMAPVRVLNDASKALEQESLGTVQMYHDGAFQTVPVYQFDNLETGIEVIGPALIIDPFSTTVIDQEWTATKDQSGALRVVCTGEATNVAVSEEHVDPVYLELFNNRFRAIADQMGHALANSAHSVNIKERLDFSCAIFDKDCNLVANAPHIPIHLGAMSESVEAVAQRFKSEMRNGDVFVLNSPYAGGAHLPDVTVVMPVFDSENNIVFYVGARGHQADIGGKTPGSMPPDSFNISEEGVLIEPMHLVKGEVFQYDEIHDLLTSARYPARNPSQNIADLQAQVAACVRGGEELKSLAAEFGYDVIAAYARYIQDASEEELKSIIDSIPEGQFTCHHDMGHHVSVKVSVDKAAKRIKVDFTGTSAQVAGNFNAPSAVARSATLYVFRTLLNRDIPLNAGCLRPIDIVIPAKSLLSPEFPAAVSSGNPETSVLVTDALYGALDVVGASQGTMNNFTFGDNRYQYYETICGGAGAGQGFDGADSVHTHMTNSLMTDPEVFELRFPVLLEEFSVRSGSGGKGRWTGGNGTRRRIRFLEPLEVAIVSNRRTIAPMGAKGGDPGAVGRNRILRADGEVIELLSCDRATVMAGDAFEIETPGGGGFGSCSDIDR